MTSHEEVDPLGPKPVVVSPGPPVLHGLPPVFPVEPDVVYKIVAKLGAGETALESGIESLEEANKLAEAYATGRESAYTDHPMVIGQPLRIFYPLHKMVAVMVIPFEKKEK